MTCDEWKKFIQVNIYGHTLQELEKQGVVLETMLNNVGCSKLWIVEGSMHSGDSSLCNSSVSSEDGSTITAPVLSTTIAEVKCPRFSTPAVAQAPLQKNFTLNLPMKLSEIHSSQEDEDVTDFEELLEELIEKVVEQHGEEEAQLVERKPILSTTIMKIGVPRYSTPIRSDEPFTFNITETLSDIESNDDDEVISDQSFEEEKESDPVEINQKLKKSVSTVVLFNRRRSRRLSAPNLKSALEKIASEPKKKRPALTKSTTERKSSRRITVKSTKSVHPRIQENFEMAESVKTLEEDSFQSVRSEILAASNQASFGGQNSFTELKPVPWSSEARFDFDGPSTSAQAAARENIVTAAPEFDFDYGESMGDDNRGRQQEDTIVMEYEQEEVVGGEDEWDEEREEKIKARASKKVSFAEPLIQSSNQQKADLNKAHTVKCYFDGCTKSYLWRKKYGKIRLVDHAISHVPELEMKCDSCDHTCRGIRQIRYHHKRNHPNIKLESFGIKRMMNTSQKDTDFSKVWDKCYKKNLVLEKGNLNPFERFDKGVRRPRNPEVHEMSEDGEQETPFYFFRIR